MALARYEGVAQDKAGNVIPNATVEVRRDQPGRPVIPLFADRDGSTPLGNPFITNDAGQFAFHIPGGAYYVRVFTGPSQAPFQQVTKRYVAIGTAGERDVEDLAFMLEAGSPVFSTVEMLQAFVPTLSEGIGGKVLTGSGAGFYHYDEAAPEGERWIFGRPLFDTLARLTVVGGTANEIEATIGAGVGDASIVMMFIVPTLTNTGEVTINDIPVLSISGEDLLPGQFVAGRSYFITDEGEHYRLRQESDFTGLPEGIVAAATEAVGEINSAKAGIADSVNSAQASATSAGLAVVSATNAATVAGLARDASFALGPKYTTEAAGRAAVADGATFLVVGSGDVAAIEYRRVNSGSSVEIARYPSAAAVTNAVKSGEPLPSCIPLFAFTNDDESVPLWLANGLLEGMGLGPAMLSQVSAQLNLGVLGQRRSSRGFGLFASRARMGSLLASPGSVIYKHALFGDSWGQRNTIGNALKPLLTAAYGEGGTGWLTLDDSLALMTGLTISMANWTKHDITEETPAGEYSPDGFRLDASVANATLTATGLKGSEIRIYHKSGNGTWRYRVDGGSWTVVAETGTGLPTKQTIAGLSTAGTHTLEIDTTGNAGAVALYGIYATGIGGVEFNKIANGGSQASNMAYAVSTATATYIMADLGFDVVTVVLGTNDSRLNALPATYRAGLSTISDAWKAAASKTAVVLVSPPKHGNAVLYPFTDYRDAVISVSDNASRVEFLNLMDSWADYAAESALGQWVDTLHLNNPGGRRFASELFTTFFKLF